MLFSKIFAAGAVMAASAMAALTAKQMSDNINQITILSQEIQAPAQSITIVNAPLIIIGQGPFPKIIAGFTKIVTTATVAISQMQGSPKLTLDADVTLVFNSFRGFVRVHQQLLNILIGKAGLLTNIPFIGPPVAAVLRQVEAVVDSIAILLIDTVESKTRAQDFESEANSLDESLKTCIGKYEGLQVQV